MLKNYYDFMSTKFRKRLRLRLRQICYKTGRNWWVSFTRLGLHLKQIWYLLSLSVKTYSFEICNINLYDLNEKSESNRKISNKNSG
jgi:hypothetical protein